MPLGVALRFLLEVLFKGRCQVDAGLIGDADQHEHNVRQFIAQVRFGGAGFETLFSIAARHDPRNFSHLFNQLSQIGKFREISHAQRLYPIVDCLLSVGNSHVIFI